MTAPCRKVWRFFCVVIECNIHVRGKGSDCRRFCVCANNMHKPLLFSAFESAPDRREGSPHNNTYNRRPFFCVFSAQIYVNDKIYIKRNKPRKKYLRIAYLGMQYYCCVLYHTTPPPDTQPTTHPTHPQIFLFLDRKSVV